MELPKAGQRTARGRHLASRLRAIREAKGLTRRHVTEELDLSASTISRIETGRQTPERRTLTALLDLYGIQGHQRTEITLLAQGATDPGGYLHAYKDTLPEVYLDFASFELGAGQLDNYESLLVPGLLQTPAYAEAVIAGTLPQANDLDVADRVDVRMQRQGVLTKDGPVQLNAVIDEAALWRVVGSPAIMTDQLRALLEPRENIRLQVIPYGAGAHPGMIGSFAILTFVERSTKDLVYVEYMGGELFRDSTEDLIRYRDIFDHLVGRALSVERSAALIESAARKHKRGG